GLFDDSPQLPPDNASCIIYEDGILSKELAAIQQDGTFELPTDIKITAGSTYYLTASGDGLPDIYTENIQIPNVIFWKNAIVRDTVDGEITIEVSFDDTPGKNNYYVIKMDKYDQGGELLTNLSLSEPFIDPSSVFSDLDFDGKTHKVILKTPRYEYFMNEAIRTHQIQIVLFSLSKELYSFFNSLNKFESTFSDPTLENYPIYSNVKNGYGILGGFSTDTITIELF
ncbi:MAG TPA: DUF4249 family protein, partial [Arcobacter sp.]|nr:DUF4249 family protein [Arcobacter sp.]